MLPSASFLMYYRLFRGGCLIYCKMPMKAVVFRQYKSPESLALIEVEKPTPREHEVLVRVHATYLVVG
jgi:hypothetical protein